MTFVQLLETLEILHDTGAPPRDMKLEVVRFLATAPEGELKLLFHILLRAKL